MPCWSKPQLASKMGRTSRCFTRAKRLWLFLGMRIEKSCLTYWCVLRREWMGLGVAGMIIIITSDEMDP